MFTLGRKIDINYRTNKIILTIASFLAGLGWIFTGEIMSGFYIGAGTFLSWALAREADPKHEYSAFIAVIFSFLNLFYYENIQLLPILWIILIMRMINGISGKELRFLDIFSVLGMTIYLSINNENSIYLIPFIVAMAFLINFKEKNKLALIAGGIASFTFILESFFMIYLSFNRIDYSNPINIVLISLVLISFTFWPFLSKKGLKDDLGNPAKSSKIFLSQISYSLTVLLIFFFGKMTINNLIIYLSVLIGIITYWLGYKLVNMKNMV